MQGGTTSAEMPRNKMHHRLKTPTQVRPSPANMSEEGVSHYSGEAQRSPRVFNEVSRGVRQ